MQFHQIMNVYGFHVTTVRVGNLATEEIMTILSICYVPASISRVTCGNIQLHELKELESASGEETLL